jgi:bifunctional non-homologous end joining protein LigD
MALEKYRAKRDFTESPEPSGDKRHQSPAGRAARFFCVQKHLASHLHYDFRLEHDGVLLSWAVPKGPSLDPATKRLAMAVEDHPVEYGDFEGVIPSGYGAGIVMLWDRGTWTPESDDVDAALRKGDLKFTLDGYKLKGSWVLVRTRGGPGGDSGRSWLLIKHRDEWSGDVDIAEFAPLSVKSGGDFADILAQDNPAIWISHRPAEGGETGAMFRRIVERALEMRAGPPAEARKTEAPKPTAAPKRASKATAAKRPAAKSRATKSARTNAVSGATPTTTATAWAASQPAAARSVSASRRRPHRGRAVWVEALRSGRRAPDLAAAW